MRRAHLTTPQAPGRVEIVYRDGRPSTPLECVYLGRERGKHIWEAVLTVPLDLLWEGEAKCAYLPPQTEVRLGFYETDNFDLEDFDFDVEP